MFEIDSEVSLINLNHFQHSIRNNNNNNNQKDVYSFSTTNFSSQLFSNISAN